MVVMDDTIRGREPGVFPGGQPPDGPLGCREVSAVGSVGSMRAKQGRIGASSVEIDQDQGGGR